MLATILIVLQIIVCAAMVGFVLMQQSEGGALGMGGGPTGFMSARGAGDLLTRITWILFSIFLLISVSMTWLTARQQANSSVLDRVKAADLNQQLPAAAPKPLVPAPSTLQTPGLAPSGQSGPVTGLPTGGIPSLPSALPAAPTAATPATPAGQPKQ